MKQTHSGIWVPDQLTGGRKFVSVVYYHNKFNGTILNGAPSIIPLPKVLADAGFEKIVCKTAHDADLWSQKMRDQEKRVEEMDAEKRDEFEGPLRKILRDQLVYGMTNSRNAINREYMRQSLANFDAIEEQRRKEKRLSYMHAEAFEDGK